MILFLCLLLPVLDLSKQEICSASGTLPAPILYLSKTSTRLGDSLQLQCAVISQAPAIRIFFCKEGEEVWSQMGSEKKFIYDYGHVVTTDSAGNYACGYEIKESDNRVNRSRLSPAKYLRVTGGSGGAEELTHTGRTMSPAVWVFRCALVLLLLVSAPIITFMLEKWGLPSLQGWRRLVRGRRNIMGKGGAESGRTPSISCELRSCPGGCLGRYHCPALSRCWGDTMGRCCTIGPCNNNLCPNFSSLLQFPLPFPRHSAPQPQTSAHTQTAQPSSFVLYK